RPRGRPGTREPSPQDRHRVGVVAGLVHLGEVQVAAGGAAGRADVADGVAGGDGGTHRGVEALQVVVAGHDAVAVIDLHAVAGGVVVLDRDHGAGLRGVHRGAAGGAEVDPVMALEVVEHGVHAPAVAGGDRTADGTQVAVVADGVGDLGLLDGFGDGDLDAGALGGLVLRLGVLGGLLLRLGVVRDRRGPRLGAVGVGVVGTGLDRRLGGLGRRERDGSGGLGLGCGGSGGGLGGRLALRGGL